MQNFYERVQEIAVMERKPLVEGRHMIMVLAPKDPAKEPKNAKTADRESVQTQM